MRIAFLLDKNPQLADLESPPDLQDSGLSNYNRGQRSLDLDRNVAGIQLQEIQRLKTPKIFSTRPPMNKCAGITRPNEREGENRVLPGLRSRRSYYKKLVVSICRSLGSNHPSPCPFTYPLQRQPSAPSFY